MSAINLHNSKTPLSRLVEAAASGQEVVIAKHGRPVAKLVPLTGQAPILPRIGAMKGKLVVPEDFDAPLPDEVLAGFYGND